MSKTDSRLKGPKLPGSAEGDRAPEGLDVKIRRYYDLFGNLTQDNFENGVYTVSDLSSETVNMLRRFKTDEGLTAGQLTVSAKNGEAKISQAAVDYLKNKYLVDHG